jgi:PAS domain S-box-containing protein
MTQQHKAQTGTMNGVCQVLGTAPSSIEILNGIAEHIVHQDTEMRVLWANKAAGDSVGVEQKELVGRHCYEIWQGSEEPCPACPVRKALKRGRPEHGEMRSPDGREWSIKGYPIKDDDGNITSMVEITMDITECKQAEASLRDSEAKYRALIEQSLQGIFVAQDKRIVFANPALCRFTGYTTRELLALGPEQVRTLLHPEDQDMVWSRFDSRIAGEDVPNHYEFRAIRKDGSVWWAEMHSNLILYNGRPAVQGVVLDTTERKLASEALKESQEKYSNLFHHSNDAILIHDLEGNIVDINQRVSDLFGYTREGALVLKICDLHPAESLETSKWAFDRIVEEGFVSFEIDFKKKNGEVFPAEVSSSMFEIGGKRVIQGIVRDITDRKLAEQELGASKERYRALVENINEVIFTLNTQGQFTYISPVMQRVLGYEPEEITNQPFNCFVHSDDVPGFLVALDRSLAGDVTPYEFRLLAKDGSIRYVMISCRPVYEEDHLKGLTGIMSDITDHKLAETELRESEEIYRTLVRTTMDAVAVSDLEGILTDVSERTLQLHGYDTPEELVGRSAFDLIAPQDHEQALTVMKKTLREGAVRNVEYTMLRKDGTQFIAELDAALIRGPEGDPKAFIAATRDITERKRAEEALAIEKERLNATLCSIGDGVIAADRESRILIFNTAAENFTGWNEEDALGKNIVDVFKAVKESSREAFGNPVPGMLEAGEMAGLVTKRAILIAKDGTERTIAYGAAPIRNRHNRVDGVVIVFSDITEKINRTS